MRRNKHIRHGLKTCVCVRERKNTSTGKYAVAATDKDTGIDFDIDIDTDTQTQKDTDTNNTHTNPNIDEDTDTDTSIDTDTDTDTETDTDTDTDTYIDKDTDKDIDTAIDTDTDTNTTLCVMLTERQFCFIRGNLTVTSGLHSSQERTVNGNFLGRPLRVDRLVPAHGRHWRGGPFDQVPGIWPPPYSRCWLLQFLVYLHAFPDTHLSVLIDVALITSKEIV